MMIGKILGALIRLRAIGTGSRPAQFGVRLAVEELEGRITPTQNTWVGASLAVWGSAGNWSTVPGPNAVPSSADTLVLRGGTGASTASSTVDAAYSVDRVDIDSTYTGTVFLTVPGTTSISTTNYFTDGGIVQVFPAALVHTDGTFYLTNGSVEVATGNTLVIDADNGVDDGGAMSVGAGGGLFITTDTYTQGSTGVILVGAGATLSINAGSSGTIAINGTIVVETGGKLVLTADIIQIGPTGSIVAGAAAAGGGVAATPPATTTAIDVGDYMDVTGILTTGPTAGPSGIAGVIAGLAPAAKAGVVFINSASLTVSAGGSLAVGAGSDIEVTDTATTRT